MDLRRLIAVALAIAAACISVPSAQATATVTYRGSYGFSGPAGLYAYGLDFDPSDNTILVGDYWNYRVQRFTTAGAWQHTYPDITGPKLNGGIPSAPYDIAVDTTDTINGQATYWAADQGSSNFAQFAHDGLESSGIKITGQANRLDRLDLLQSALGLQVLRH